MTVVIHYGRVLLGVFAVQVLSLATPLLADPPGTKPVEGLRENPPSLHALVNATLVVAPNQMIEKGTLVIRDGSIIAVGAELALPAGAMVHDMSGKRLYSGLMDSYSETQVPSPTAVYRHWNSLVTPEASVADSYQPDATVNTKLRRQGVVCRLVAPDSGVIKGSSCIASTSDLPGSQSLWKATVAQHVRLGLSRNRGIRGYPSSPMGAVALARQTFLDAQWYPNAWLAFRGNSSLAQPERNSALEVLAEHLGRGDRFIIDSANELYLLRADAFAREFSLNAIIRGSGQEYQRLEAVRSTGRLLILPVNFPSPPAVDTPEAIHAASLSELLHWNFAPENPARLHAAGVQFSLSSADLSDVSEFLSNIRTAVKRGLPADVALAALTTTPAAMFGIDQRYGTISVGKSASFLVSDGDLFATETKILETWIDGKRYPNKGTDDLDIRGKWEVRLSSQEGDAENHAVVIQGTPDRLKGHLILPDADTNEQQETGSDAPSTDQSSAEQSDLKDENPEEREGEDSVSEEPVADEQEGVTKEAEKADDTETESDDPETDDNQQDAKKPEKRSPELAFTKLSLDDRTLTGSLPGKQLGLEGTIQFSATLMEVGGQPLQATGRLVLPDGKILLLSATRTSTDEKADEKHSSGPGRRERRSPAVQPEEPSSDTTEDANANQAASASEDSTVEPKKLAPVEFSINYPLGAFGRTSLPEQPPVLVFQNATVWTCTDAGVIEGATVIVQTGKIADVGSNLPIPDNATIIDATGKHLTPGMIDCHSHTATDGGINESAQSITAEVRIGDFINCDDTDIYRQLAGGITTANVLHGSANPIGGQNQVIKFRWGELYDAMRFREAPPGIKFALGENVKRSNRPDGFNDRYPASRMGVEQLIRDAFQAAKDYQAQWALWQRDHNSLPPRKDLELEALSEILRGERWVHCHSYRQDEILALLRTCEEYGIRIATLQHILEGYKVADAMARHGAMGSSFSDWWAYKVEVYDAIPYNGALMHQAGIVVSFNSDDRELARHMNHEAAKAIRYGNIEPEEALKFVTLNPAKQLRIDAYVGSIEAGKHADLVLWSGPPLSLQSRCEQTWIDGKRYFDIQEDLQMRETARTQLAQLVQKVIASGQPSRRASEQPLAEESLWPMEDEFCRARNLR